MSDNNITFKDILSGIKQYMILQDDDELIIDILLAASLSIELNQPIWIMIIAPPSSGKTELLNILSELDNFFIISNLTPKFLFSGHPSAQGGYMIRVVKEKGILAFKDFTTVLSSNSKSRKEIFNQLRVIFDGHAGLGTGIDVGQSKFWEGKVAVISLVTPTIEKIKESTSDLGERFLYFKYNPTEKGFSSFRDFKVNIETKQKLPGMVKDFIKSKTELVTKVEIPLDIDEKIFNFAKFISIGRANVERNGRREVELIHPPEEPHRVRTLLQSLYKALIIVNGDNERTQTILRHIAISSIPLIRMRILIQFHRLGKSHLTMEEIQSRIPNLSESKIRRTVEDMVAQNILKLTVRTAETKHYYSITEKFNHFWSVIIGKE